MGHSSQQIVVKVNGQEFMVEVGDLDASPIIAVVDGRTYEVVVGDDAAGMQSKPAIRLSKSRKEISAPQTDQDQSVAPPGRSDRTSVQAPLPGNVVAVNVQPGQQVNKGDPLCIIDAMKMNNVIRSPRDGSIASVEVSTGQLVDFGDVLITYE